MSNAPQLPTGYGVVTKNVTKRLKDLGYDIVIAGFSGFMKGISVEFEEIPVLPVKYDPFMKDVISQYYNMYKCDMLIAHFDIWVAPWLPKLLPTVCYSPLDMIFQGRIVEVMLPILRSCKYIIPFTEEAEDIVRKDLGNVREYIPHGVDTTVFKPLDKEEVRKELGIDKDCFLIGIAAANMDRVDRKNFYGALKTVKKFIEETKEKDIKIYIHSDIKDYVRGIHLDSLVKQFGLDHITYVTEPIYFTVGISEEKLVKIYNSFDVLLNLVKRGGFELIPLECMACGVPALMTDWYNLREYLPKEMRVRIKAVTGNALAGEIAIADEDHAVEILKKLYYDTSFYEKIRRKGLEVAKKYEWNKIIKKWDRFFQTI